jgi:hypothetical protein
MTIEDDVLCADLRAWLKSPAIGLADYSAELVVQRRLGRMLANAKFSSRGRTARLDSVGGGKVSSPQRHDR